MLNLSIKEKFGSNPFEDLESYNVYIVKVSASHCLWSHEPYISANWKKACLKVAKLHEHISNTRKDFHYKVANQLCDEAGMIFAEDLNLKAMSRGMLGKHTLDAGFGQFLNILEFVTWKRGVYFERVDFNLTSQTCPRCQTITGKKEIYERVHSCSKCGYTTDRDVAAAQIVQQRGVVAIGHIVEASGGIGLRRSRAKEESHALLAVGVSKLSTCYIVECARNKAAIRRCHKYINRG